MRTADDAREATAEASRRMAGGKLATSSQPPPSHVQSETAMADYIDDARRERKATATPPPAAPPANPRAAPRPQPTPLSNLDPNLMQQYLAELRRGKELEENRKRRVGGFDATGWGM